ncbi:ABC transporter permease [Photobacterium gaetbulicola]|uniref:Transport system permease protein n=1 Tax=Photobacterium gaetbulicola Gung47 TaxID=658445 RepID=A0A0C5W3W4_9GAMM|nr:MULTISPECIES: iron chelate uptake ABC transporter family permease subunit [Photobacterium]AJR06146.1 transport system permease protein [Photobacterium gaetbulicola Gung47]PSU02292.1 ABC transporter permease [Photobacterium gaetbulicola]WEM45430.1 iron chelate uptake ABC transporter family permease subunit [Photobacterium sp. DA100]
MRDSIKVSLLAVLGVLITAYFIGQGLNAQNYQFFLSLRLPKIMAIVLAAIAISTSSLVFQTITNNRILTPSILGFDSLYVMIQVIIVVMFGSMSVWFADAKINFLLTTLIMSGFSMLLFTLYFRRANSNVFTLLLIGIVCGSLFSSISSFFTMILDPNEFANLQNTMFASFNNVNGELVYWSMIPLGLCLAYLYTLSNKLDVFWLGTDNAKSLGVDTHKVTMQVMMVITLMVAISTALVGPVLFFGLIVVSLTRQLFQSYHHRFLMLAASTLSVVLLVGGQWLIEKVFAFDTTISVIINFVGGSYFLFLLMRNKF